MERKDIEDQVKQFLVAAIEVDAEKITPDAKLKADLGIDSLDFVDIVVLVDRKFGFNIKQEEMTGVDTFSKFCDYIESQVT